jgi:hypothetical protein
MAYFREAMFLQALSSALTVRRRTPDLGPTSWHTVHGQFGENFTIEGLQDDAVCIGDRYQIGSAVSKSLSLAQPAIASAFGWTSPHAGITDIEQTAGVLFSGVTGRRLAIHPIMLVIDWSAHCE